MSCFKRFYLLFVLPNTPAQEYGNSMLDADALDYTNLSTSPPPNSNVFLGRVIN